MVKTLRIISVITAILAVAVVFCAAAFGADSDDQIEKFLNSPDAIEIFKKASTSRADTTKSEVSPLVKAAQAFALYLNPPARPAAARKSSKGRGSAKSVPRPTSPVSAKFDLIGTSFHATRPELSRALINQVGKGFQWVKQAGSVGHLIIEQIKDGTVIVRDGNKTQELVPSRPPVRSLIRGQATPAGDETDTRAVLKGLGIAEVDIENITSAQPEPKRPVVDEQDKALMDKFIKDLQAANSSDVNSQEDGKKSGALMEKLISDLKTSRVSPQEAENLQNLGKELKGVQEDNTGTEEQKAGATKKSNRVQKSRPNKRPSRRPRRR